MFLKLPILGILFFIIVFSVQFTRWKLGKDDQTKTCKPMGAITEDIFENSF